MSDHELMRALFVSRDVAAEIGLRSLRSAPAEPLTAALDELGGWRALADRVQAAKRGTSLAKAPLDERRSRAMWKRVSQAGPLVRARLGAIRVEALWVDPLRWDDVRIAEFAATPKLCLKLGPQVGAYFAHTLVVSRAVKGCTPEHVADILAVMIATQPVVEAWTAQFRTLAPCAPGRWFYGSRGVRLAESCVHVAAHDPLNLAREGIIDPRAVANVDTRGARAFNDLCRGVEEQHASSGSTRARSGPCGPCTVDGCDNLRAAACAHAMCGVCCRRNGKRCARHSVAGA
jgi:hypothetical protein